MGLFDFFDQNAYIISGHGGDSGNFNTRNKLPKGYTLVTNDTCGRSIINSNYRKKLTNIQKLNKKIYTKPYEFKKNLNFRIKGLHVFTSGDSYPDMTISFDSHFQNNNPYLVTTPPVGIFKIPSKITLENKSIHKDEINLANVNEIINSIFFNEDNILKKYFKNELSDKIITEIEKYKKTNNITELFSNLKITYTLKDLITKKIIPEGVYYIFICREFIGTNKTKIINTQRRSLNQQQKYNLTRKSSNTGSSVGINTNSNSEQPKIQFSYYGKKLSKQGGHYTHRNLRKKNYL
jgi:hypothetical protein